MIPPELAAFRLVLREDVPLSGRTTLRIGGPARFFAEVEDAEALAGLLRWARGGRLPVLLLGKGSNVLIPDEGFPGVAVVLSGDFRSVAVRGTEVGAGGGVSLMSLAVVAEREGLSGLEGLWGIPSSVGGAVRINAGSYGTEIFDLLVSLELVSRAGDRRDVPASEIPHGYRWTALVESKEVVASATLRLREADPETIRARMAEVAGKRKKALPSQPNAGSIFRNPPGDFAGRLLEACGMKGRRVGGAEVSAVHANVIVNRGGATARDVRSLMTEMRRAVKERFGVELDPEIEVLPPASVE
ncbi:MAG TPA: UDP-N-acetylmuramate dehydrogenase [Thermoanaerobaculia bacterium]|nr:UDP-N-acetylmuramate dehydrogenase [Thermoanaerobaculia bacterium]